MDLELVKQILIISIASSIISTAVVQKIKEQLKSKKWLFLVSFIVSVVTGVLFALNFSEVSLINSIWVGIVTWVGADTIYKAFESKLFTKFSDIEQVTEIKRDDE